MDNTTAKVLKWSAISMASVIAGGATGDLLDSPCAKGEDTSACRKARKERARMLSIARQEELKRDSRPPKKRGGRRK